MARISRLEASIDGRLIRHRDDAAAMHFRVGAGMIYPTRPTKAVGAKIDKTARDRIAR